jgi:hypothetical protein
MSTTRRTGPGSGSESGPTASELPTLELPARGGEEGRDVAGARSRTMTKLPDYDDDKVKDRWKKIIERQREELETDVLQITRPRAKLDPIASEILDGLCARLISRDAQTKEGATGKSTTPEELEKQVRAFIVEKGIASEVKKVTQRLNARRMTDGRRWVLSETYVFLLARLFQDKAGLKAEELEELMGDDLGVAEKIMLDLEAENGPLDVFANLIVKSVMERNRIGKSKTLQELVAQQVRAAI